MVLVYAQVVQKSPCADTGRMPSMRRVKIRTYADSRFDAHRFGWAEDLISQGDITLGWSYILRVVTMEARRALPLADIAQGRGFGLSRPAPLVANRAQVRLGQALAARVAEITRSTGAATATTHLAELTSPRFAKQVRDVHALTSRAIARFLISGQGTTETERNFISRVGIIAARSGLSLAFLARSYVEWRDANLQVLNEEIARLRVGYTVSSVARKIVRSTADTGLRRMARAYEYQLQAGGGCDQPLAIQACRSGGAALRQRSR
jgi:hypothetical protein